MNIEMIPVSSSNIAAVGYDAPNQITRVEFLNGSAYIYRGVPQHEFDALLNASSVGSYFNRNFRNVYPYERIS